MLAVGGIDLDLAPWIRAGARGFGVGGALYRPGDDAREVGQRARQFADAWARCEGDAS